MLHLRQRTRVLIGTGVGAVVLAAGITSASAAAPDRVGAELSGSSVVPMAGDPDGSGSVRLTIRGDEVCYHAKFKDVAEVEAIHVHQASAGSTGPMQFELFHGLAEAHGRTIVLNDCVTADQATLDAVVANPSGYYVNVHNMDHMSGAVRGQLS
jgi:hypothetical protein